MDESTPVKRCLATFDDYRCVRQTGHEGEHTGTRPDGRGGIETKTWEPADEDTQPPRCPSTLNGYQCAFAQGHPNRHERARIGGLGWHPLRWNDDEATADLASTPTDQQPDLTVPRVHSPFEAAELHTSSGRDEAGCGCSGCVNYRRELYRSIGRARPVVYDVAILAADHADAMRWLETERFLGTYIAVHPYTSAYRGTQARRLVITEGASRLSPNTYNDLLFDAKLLVRTPTAVATEPMFVIGGFGTARPASAVSGGASYIIGGFGGSGSGGSTGSKMGGWTADKGWVDEPFPDGSLTSSGGWCAPSEALLPRLNEVDDSPLRDLDEVKVEQLSAYDIAVENLVRAELAKQWPDAPVGVKLHRSSVQGKVVRTLAFVKTAADGHLSSYFLRVDLITAEYVADAVSEAMGHFEYQALLRKTAGL